MSRSTARGEGGAVAVMYALLITVVLMPVAALSVDLGNAISRRTTTQGQADYAAFAASDHMTGTEVAGATPASAMLDAVATSMNANQPQDDDRPCWRTNNCVTASALRDSDMANGEVQYLTSRRVKVTAPSNQVDFGLANALGVSDIRVGASATVTVKSAGLRVLPMFAVDGCDYGRQTLTDPANGHTPSATPTLANDTDTNVTGLTAASLTLYDSTNAVVPNVVVNSTGNQLSFSGGNKWKDSTKVGFFREGLAAPVPEAVAFGLAPSTTGYGTTAPDVPYTDNGNATVRVRVPDVVAQTQAIWYVRVWSDRTNSDAVNAWSSQSEALPFRVGTPVLECISGSVQGNFGTLSFPRSDVPTASNLPVNIMEGLQAPLTSDIHRQVSANGECSDGVNGAVESYEPDVLKANSNCVDTNTGLTANDATQGFITGLGTRMGLFTRSPTADDCSPDGDEDERRIDLGPGPDYDINDDTLSCFLTNGKSLADVAAESYTGGCAFVTDIIDSPRFVQVPVLAAQPGNGGSNRYSIIDYRPGFVTDEAVLASTVRGSRTASAENGVVISNNGITTLRVVFFNRGAIEGCGEDVPLMDYLGVGTPIPVLTEVE